MHGVPDVCRRISSRSQTGCRDARRGLSSRAALTVFGRPLRAANAAWVSLGLAGLAALAGCGGGGSDTGKAARPAKGAGLSKAILPRCGVSQFDRRKVSPVVVQGVHSWQLSYLVGPNAPQI